MPRFTRRTLTYGLGGGVDFSALNIRQSGGASTFEVAERGETAGEVTLRIPGVHNVRNALAAYAAARELGVTPEVALKGLAGFAGVDRRSQVKGEARGILVLDDYGHHPTEIKAVLSALRDSYKRRVVALFQPHRYSRTKDLLESFETAFYGADLVFVTDVYGAGEAPLPGVTAELLADGIRNHGHRAVHYTGGLETSVEEALAHLVEDDLFITLGAGNVWQAGETLLERLRGGGDV